MADINQEIEQIVAEMREVGKQAAPCKGGNYNNLLRYNELRERILSKFLEVFDTGGRLEMPTLTPPNEPLTLEELRQMDGQPVWVEDVKHWALIDIEKGGQWDSMPFATWNENGVRFCYNIINRNLLCYRRPPEEEEETKDEIN
jgi:hypothetical protein